VSGFTWRAARVSGTEAAVISGDLVFLVFKGAGLGSELFWLVLIVNIPSDACLDYADYSV
jgi:hypothetical protein